MWSVAPFTGAWIEIPRTGGLPLYGRVAPFTGAWIEMCSAGSTLIEALVAPFTGAWIEMLVEEAAFQEQYRRTLHGCVD